VKNVILAQISFSYNFYFFVVCLSHEFCQEISMIFKQEKKPILLSVQKIWDQAPHNALTDLIFFQNRWFCVFRESNKHVKGNNGRLRLLSSTDGTNWTSTHLFEEEGVDLRDPKLSITPNGHLMLLSGGTHYNKYGTYINRQPRAAFSADAVKWTPFFLILKEHEWLWRVTWHLDTAYGISYRYSDPTKRKQEWIATLYSSRDGVHYNPITQLNIPGYPNEATIQFLSSNEMIALVRREKKNNDHAWIGTSAPPFSRWEWSETEHYFGGPNFIVLPDQHMWAAGRIVQSTPYGLMEKTVLAKMERDSIHPELILPSAGDTSYPGMVFQNGLLWISYYSSHEEKTSIYLAKVQL
jgi:hypothetical protein